MGRSVKLVPVLPVQGLWVVFREWTKLVNQGITVRLCADACVCISAAYDHSLGFVAEATPLSLKHKFLIHTW